jgi:hypothetical protein
MNSTSGVDRVQVRIPLAGGFLLEPSVRLNRGAMTVPGSCT